MKSKQSEDYIKGFADGIKANQNVKILRAVDILRYKVDIKN